jgi:hypothetical protein
MSSSGASKTNPSNTASRKTKDLGLDPLGTTW